MFNKLILLALVCSLLTPIYAEKITVAGAANVQYALKELATVFEQNTGIQVETIFGSSGKLTAQIKNGAPFDVFLSADTKYPQALYKENFASISPQIYAYGSLVLWSTTLKTISGNVKLLINPGISKIAIADPQNAPYGLAAVEVLKYAGVLASVNAKLVYGESINQTNQFIASGAVDLGFTSKSTVVAPEIQGQGVWVEIPHIAYAPIAQSIALLKYGTENHPLAAKKFYDFVLSAKAQKIWDKYGYARK